MISLLNTFERASVFNQALDTWYDVLCDGDVILCVFGFVLRLVGCVCVDVCCVCWRYVSVGGVAEMRPMAVLFVCARAFFVWGTGLWCM